MEPVAGPWSRAGRVAIGLLLVVVGIVFLFVNWYDVRLPFDLAQVGWPLYIIVPGVVLLLAGLLTSSEAGIGLATGVGIITTIGHVLAYQQATDHWASWAHAWALIAPASVGAAMLLWGLLHGRGGVVRSGLSALVVGLVLFLLGFAFFEGVLSIGGRTRDCATRSSGPASRPDRGWRGGDRQPALAAPTGYALAHPAR